MFHWFCCFQFLPLHLLWYVPFPSDLNAVCFFFSFLFSPPLSLSIHILGILKFMWFNDYRFLPPVPPLLCLHAINNAESNRISISLYNSSIFYSTLARLSLLLFPANVPKLCSPNTNITLFFSMCTSGWVGAFFFFTILCESSTLLCMFDAYCFDCFSCAWYWVCFLFIGVGT